MSSPAHFNTARPHTAGAPAQLTLPLLVAVLIMFVSAASMTGCKSGGGLSAGDGGSSGTSSSSSGGSNTNPPVVLSVTPVTGSTGISRFVTVSVRFDQNMQSSSINATNFQVIGPNGAVSGTRSYSSSSRTATFNASGGFLASTSYTISISENVRNSNGIAMGQTVTSTFATRADSDPVASACTGFYAGSFALASGTTNHNESIPTVAKPTRGRAMMDARYNTCVVRVTDHTADGISGFTRNDYSRRQAFNADNTQQLVYSLDGAWHTYDANTYTHLRRLSSSPSGPAGDAEPHWHPTDPSLLYYLPTSGTGMRIMQINVDTGAVTTVADLSTRIRAIWSNASAAWTKSEGSPSADARYWGFMIDDAQWRGLGLITYDLHTDTIVGSYSFAANGVGRPDHVSMSPSGNYIVPSWDGNALGTTAFSRDFSTSRKLHHKSEHSDIALDANGDDIYVAVDYQSSGGTLYMINLRTGVTTNLFNTYISGTATAYHVSGKAYDKPGWILLSTYANNGGAQQWLHRKIMAVQLSANPTVYHIAHHHSVTNGYWTEPHASVSRDFTRIAFSSNWEVNSSTDLDSYQVELPANALP